MYNLSKVCDEFMKGKNFVMNENRKFIYIENFIPVSKNEGDEIFRNDVFHINVSRILEDIHSGDLQVERERIHVKEWFVDHYRPMVNENCLPHVDVTEPVIQAEIRPGMYSIIDGNHRGWKKLCEKAFHISTLTN